MEKKRQGFTFNESEVEALERLFGMLYRGGDVKVLLRSKEIQDIARRFNERAKRTREEKAAAVARAGTEVSDG